MVKAEGIYSKLKQDWQKSESNLPSYEDDDPTWTKKILNYFHNEGRSEYGFVSHREYLRLDLVWSIEGERQYEDYFGLELALESEWGGSQEAIMEDFYKLIDVKSFLKIMIISRSQQATDEMIEIMSKTVQKGRIKFPEEEYLIIIFPPTSQGVGKEGQLFSGYKISSQGNYQKLQPYFNICGRSSRPQTY